MITRGGMKPSLRDPSLLLDSAYHSGRWAGSASGAVHEVRDPSDGSLVGTVPMLTAAETEDALVHAADAMESWKREPASKRAAILSRWHDLLVAHADDLAAILTSEQHPHPKRVPLPAGVHRTYNQGGTACLPENSPYLACVFFDTAPLAIGARLCELEKEPRS